MLALAAYEGGLCDCGFHADLTEADDVAFTLDQRQCPVCAADSRWKRMAEAEDAKLRGDEPRPDRKDRADGRKVWFSASEKN